MTLIDNDPLTNPHAAVLAAPDEHVTPPVTPATAAATAADGASGSHELTRKLSGLKVNPLRRLLFSKDVAEEEAAALAQAAAAAVSVRDAGGT